MDEPAKPTQTGKTRAVRRVARFGLHGFALLFALNAYFIAGLFFMVSGEGIVFNSLHEPVEKALTEKAGAQAVEIGEVRLIRDARGRHPLKLTVTEFRMDQGGGRIVELPKISMRIDGPSMLRGRVLPKFVEIDGATVEIVRREDDLDVGGSLDVEELIRLASLISDVSGGFEGAVLNEFTFAYADIEAGTRFRAEGGTASLRVENDDYDFTMVVPFEEADGTKGSLSLNAATRPSHGSFTAELLFNRAPMAELLEIFFADNEQLSFDVPVSGNIRAAGSVIQGLSRLNIDLSVGEGTVKLRDAELPVAALDLKASHNVLSRTLTIDSLGFDAAGAAGNLAGTVTYETATSGMSGIDFDLLADQVTVTQEGMFDGPVPLENVTLVGGYDVASHEIRLENLEADYFDARLKAEASLRREDGAGIPAIKAQASIDGHLTVEQVLRGWPIPAADGARQWVVSGMPKADVSGVTFVMDVPANGFTPEGLSEDALVDLNFRAEDATVIYTPGMTPVTGLNATGRILGNSFSVTADRGRIGKVRITGGGVEMPYLVPKGGPGIFTVKFDGQVSDILGIVDEEPLGYISEAGFEPSSFEGMGEFTLTLVRPLLSYVPIEDYEFNGKGSFTGVTFEPFGATLPLVDGSGTVSLTEKGMTITGLADAAGIPASFEWSRPFGDRITQTLVAEAKISPRTADAFGLPLRRFLRGEVNTRISAEGNKSGFQKAAFEADLTPAALFLENGRILKPEGQPGHAAVNVALPGQVPVIQVERLAFTMPGANFEGNARFTPQGGLIDMDLPRIWMDGVADMSVRLTRDDRRVKLSVSGDYADASGLIDNVLSARPSKNGGNLPGGVDLDVSLARVGLKGYTELLDVEVSGHHDGAEMARLTAKGVFEGGGQLDVVLGENPAGLGEDVTITTDRFGRLLNGVFGITSVLGGEVKMTATFIDEGPMAGQFEATNLTLRNAPTVARLLSIGSLDGLANVLNGEGLEFDHLKGDLQLKDGELKLVDAQLTGSALGLSANGAVNLESESFNLHGAVAPAYRVNSMFGSLPGLGDLFVSRDGEGIFALAYRVEGPMADATVQVNTLAALTPGIFRRVFEPVGDEEPTTAELLKAAEEAAGDLAARDFLSTPELLREYEREQTVRDDLPSP
ncbi:DUF3971 domain-containing protein [Parvularcula marina]|uniref:DUF3971 domain-containing protein n=1 Tax=Parvularcula marina TaxID=2292771 RepID=A0A371RKS0_9PROT|nr:DUF3971 domain-containing protein [Parvularcula marina]RFB06062.1 DUF3971 domain-containing protein [Parvularcula marina]